MTLTKLELTLETVTPLFLRGEDNNTPELRPPAFRGVMRYWFRAMLGGIVGDDLKQIRHYETMVFGSTDEGSPIVIRISYDQALRKEKVHVLPHKNQGARPAFKPQQIFNLSLLARPGTTPEIWQAACASLQVLLLLGGVGLRSRRGYGSLRVVKSSDQNLVRIFPDARKNWVQFIKDALASSVRHVEALVGRRTNLQNNLPKFPRLQKDSVVRLGSQDYATSIDAVKHLMSAMPKQNFVGFAGPGSLRQASPLWARVINADGRYFLLMSVLPSSFDGSDYKKLNEKVRSFSGLDIVIQGWNTNE